MTQPLPLTGTALEIARRLEAHQTVDHVTEVGRWRRSWQQEDVLAVKRWLRLQAAERDRDHPPVGPLPERKAKPKPAQKHGTRRCYDTGCRRPECVEAKREYQREWMRGRTGGAA